MPPVINEDKCIHCGLCIEICPSDVFFGSKKGEIPNITYPDECWHSEACALHCPKDAITFRIPLTMIVSYKKLNHDNQFKI